MKTYEYKGFQASGHAIRGLIEASGLKDARERLAAGGILVENISPAASRGRRILFRREQGFDAETRSSIYRELSSMMKAGLTLTQSLQLLMEATEESSGTKLLLAGLRDRVQEGASMAQALFKTGGGAHAMELAAVRVSLANLRTFPCIEEKEKRGTLKLRGALFAISDGILHVLDEATGEFSPA